MAHSDDEILISLKRLYVHPDADGLWTVVSEVLCDGGKLLCGLGCGLAAELVSALGIDEHFEPVGGVIETTDDGKPIDPDIPVGDGGQVLNSTGRAKPRFSGGVVTVVNDESGEAEKLSAESQGLESPKPGRPKKS